MTEVRIPETWDRAGLSGIGFVGFVPFIELGDLVPGVPGIYAVLRPSGALPTFLEVSPAQWQKGKDPTYSVAKLQRKWLDRATLMYLGKASPQDGLRGRLNQFRNKAANHWGGRGIWQLADAEALLVAWLATPNRDPEHEEKKLLRAFKAAYGSYPFANWRL